MPSNDYEIRLLLRLAHRPRDAEKDALGQLLRNAYGTRTVREAIVALVNETFPDGSRNSRLHHETVERCDLRGEPTKVAAHAMGVSVRQLFRYRGEAVSSIAEVVQRVLQRTIDPPRFELALARLIASRQPEAALAIFKQSGADTAGHLTNGDLAFDVVRTSLWAGIEPTPEQLERCRGVWHALALAEIGRHAMALGRQDAWLQMRERLVAELKRHQGPDYAPAAFELAGLDRIDSRRTCDLRASAEATERLRRFARSDSTRVALAMVAHAEQACSDGDTTAAALNLGEAERVTARSQDPVLLARCALAQAALSLMYERYDEAFAFASAATTVMPGIEAGFTVRAASLAGRAALLGGRSWSSAIEVPSRYGRVWTLAEHHAVVARHLLGNDVPGAEERAARAIALAEDQGACGALAWARATMAEVLFARGDRSKAEALRITAFGEAVRLRDHSLLFDMFWIPSRDGMQRAAWSCSESLVEMLVRLCLDDMDGGNDVARSRSLLHDAVARSVGRALALESRAAKSDRSSRDAANATDSRSNSLLDGAGHTLSTFLPYIVAPDQRQSFRTRFRQLWRAATTV